MRLLDRYLLRELLVPLIYCLAGFLIFWISFDLFTRLDNFQEKGVPMVEVGRYYLLNIPDSLVEVIPIALLLALLYSLTNHARHNELTAIRTAGVSLWRLSLPYFGVGVIFTGLLFVVNEWWVPRSAEQTEAILRRVRVSESLPNGRWELGLNFRNARDERTWNIGAFNLDTFELINPQVDWRMHDGRRSLIATNAIWTNGSWTFFGVQEFFYPKGAATTDTNAQSEFTYTSTNSAALSVPEFSETPEQIKSEIKIGKLTGVKAAKEAQLSIAEIMDYLRLHPDVTPIRRALLFTQLHGRLAYPCTCIVVVLIALPFGAASNRRNAFVGVAASIFICFAFFVFLKFGLALGTGRYVPPWLAAWLPNIFFTATGLALTSRLR